MRYSGTDFNLLYVDPGASPGGDGSVPAKALNALPGSFSGNTCLIIRRTAEASHVSLPVGSQSCTGLLLFGMPKATDDFWQFVPPEAQSAWGADEADYAQVLFPESGGDPSMGPGSSVELPSVRTFLLHRCHCFRENAEATSTMFDIGDQGYAATVAVEHCKFGCLGQDLESPAYVARPAFGMGGYMHCGLIHSFAMRDTTVNIRDGGGGYYYGGSYRFYVEKARFVVLDNVDVWTTTLEYNGYESGPALQMSSDKSGGRVAYTNLRFHILVDGASGYLPRLFYDYGSDFTLARGISVTLEQRHLGEELPATLQLYGPMFSLLSCREYRIDGFSATLPGCRRLSSGSAHVFEFSGNAWSELPGNAKSLNGISIALAETGFVDAEGADGYYSDVKYSDESYLQYYSALCLSFNSGSGGNGSECVRVTNVSVVHPYGVAAYIDGGVIRNAMFKGAVKCRRSNADISSIETAYPGHALMLRSNAVVRVGAITVTNPQSDPVVDTSFSGRCFAYVDACNAPLCSDVRSTSTNCSNAYAVICGNEAGTGHFTQRTNNCQCDTWNVVRTGGGAASFKLWNNAAAGDAIILGVQPFRGILLKAKAGANRLVIRCAVKGITDLSELGRRLLAQVELPDGRMLLSSSSGRWSVDPDSEWTGDTGLTALRLELPFTLETGGEADVRIHYDWHHASGYFYIDPAMSME